MNWLHGKPTTVNPRGPYSSCSASSWEYCGVSPQRLATLTTSAGLPPVSSPKVVASPCSVVTGASRRSLMPAPARGRAGSFRRHARPLASSGTSTACCRSASSGTTSRARTFVAARTTPAARPDARPPRRSPRLVGLQPPSGDDTPPVAGPQSREGELRPWRGQVVAEVPLHRQELRRHHRADRVAAEVLRPAGAQPVPVEPGERVGAARLQLTAQHVALLGHGRLLARRGGCHMMASCGRE